jgi:CheY-like chemotaxis protein
MADDIAAAQVVVIDDNPATLYATSRVLRAAGFKVHEAVNGEEGLKLASGAADIVLLDVNLPDIHGFEVCQRLRKDPRTARLPVIHVSQLSLRKSIRHEALMPAATVT